MRAAAGLLLLGLGACGGPEPLDLAALDRGDRLFALPAAPPPEETILRKEELTLGDVLAIADAMNPELEAERQKIGLAEAAILDASIPPNPSVLLEAEEYRTEDGATMGRMKRTAGLSFPLAVGGRLGAAVSAAEAERGIAVLEYAWRRREILSGVKRAFLGLLAARRGAELARETRDLAGTLHDVTRERFRAQAVPEMELLKAAVTLAKADIDLRLSEKEAEVALERLRARMGNVALPHDRFRGELLARFASPSLEALRGQVTALHPLLEAAVLGKEAAERELDAARAARIPDVTVDVLVGRDPEDGTIVEGGLSLPLPLLDRNQGRVAAAEIRIRQAELRIQSVRNDLLLRLAEAHRDFTAGQERAEVYAGEILPKAERAAGQTREGYRAGKLAYLDLLDAQRTLAEARIANLAALSDLNLAAAELELLTGAALEPAGREDR